MILVTGGSGLVGSHLLYELCKNGEKVRAIRRNASRLDLLEKLFEWYDPLNGPGYFQGIDWVEADLDDISSLGDALDGISRVYHCAAMVSFLPQDRAMMMKVNVSGTANLVNLALQKGIEKFCHCSSVAAIGKPERGNKIDESLVWKTSAANSWYAISKYGAEREVWRASEEGLNVVIANPTVVIGPGDPARSSAQLYLSVKNGLKFYTSGVTGFVDARDVASAMVQLMDSEISSQRFIVNSENLPYRKVFEYFAAYAGTPPPRYRAGKFLSEAAWRLEWIRTFFTGQKPLITRETARNANTRRYFSNERIAKALGIRFRSVEEAAANTAAFYQKHPVFLSHDFRM